MVFSSDSQNAMYDAPVATHVVVSGNVKLFQFSIHTVRERSKRERFCKEGNIPQFANR